MNDLNMPAQGRRAPSIALALALALLAIFSLPYLVPVHDGISYSYMFGFNNRVALIVLLVVTAAFGLWSHGLGMSLPDTSQKGPGAFRRIAYVAIGATVVGSIVLWLFSIPIAPLGEAQYFIDRYETYRQLGSPYKAFTFYYGPVMFYLPIWLAHLTHLSVANCYFLALILEWGLGTWMLWRTVVMAARGTLHGLTIFIFFWLFFLATLLGSGAQYTPLRFCSGPFFVLLVCERYRSNATAFAIFSMASLGTMATLFYSPEQGAAFVLGTLAFFLVCARRRLPDLRLGLAGFGVVVALACVAAWKIGEFDALASIGGGALNFPILANPHTIFLMLLLILAGCVVVAAFQNGTQDHPLVYLTLLSIFTLPAAFGRADIGHIIINALGALIAVLIVLSQYHGVWQWLRFALLIFIVTLLYGMIAYRPEIRDKLLQAAFGERFHSPMTEKIVESTFRVFGGSHSALRIEELRAQFNPKTVGELPALPSDTRFYAPLGIQRRMVPYPGVGDIETGRSVYPMTGTAVVWEKIDELGAHADWPILLPQIGTDFCLENANQVRVGLTHQMGVLYVPPVRHSVVAAIPLCHYIETHYAQTRHHSPVPGYIVWVPKWEDK